jgi:hypothetical protein
MLDSGCSMLDNNLIVTIFIVSRIQRPVSSINALMYKNYKSLAAKAKGNFYTINL